MIPHEVKLEVVERGKEEGMGDAFLIESEIENGWILIDHRTNEKVKEIAEKVGIDIGEVAAIMLARKKKCQGPQKFRRYQEMRRWTPWINWPGLCG